MFQVGDSKDDPFGEPWWSDAVFYQVYPRSFAAGSSTDGVGDLSGITTHLDHLVDLGVDALWLSPMFPSPQRDHGYDVSDYSDVDPMFGSLADFDDLLRTAHQKGLRVTIDLVPNHSSDQHAWFQRAVAAGRGSQERERYLFRDGRGDGSTSPTDVGSTFGGPAWTRVVEPDGSPGQWYFHLFAPEQPDLNWDNPQVLEDFRRIWRFWLDRGVDGFRIDVADALTKDIDRDDVRGGHDLLEHGPDSRTHAVWRRFRADLDSYEPPRTAVGEVWAPGEAQALYARPGEFPMTFNFPFMKANWDPIAMRRTIDEALWRRGSVGATPTWVIENHDEERAPTRLSDDLAVGTKRARALALALLSLPGVAYIYQGQELGLPNVDLPDDVLQDPIWERSGHTIRGRDGCRVPLPWSGTRSPYGFAQADVDPWLPQPDAWGDLSVQAQQADGDSFLALYRGLLHLRSRHSELRRGALAWLSEEPDRLHYERVHDGSRLTVLINLGSERLPMPTGRLLASSQGVVSRPGAKDVVGPDEAVWVRPEQNHEGDRR